MPRNVFYSLTVSLNFSMLGLLYISMVFLSMLLLYELLLNLIIAMIIYCWYLKQ